MSNHLSWGQVRLGAGWDGAHIKHSHKRHEVLHLRTLCWFTCTCAAAVYHEVYLRCGVLKVIKLLHYSSLSYGLDCCGF